MTADFLDRNNPEQQAAYEMIEKTSNSFFLAGRAGTGKTTFLKNVQRSTDKQFIVLAPTGIAAINAGGQTIHSFFGFNFGVLGPGYVGTMNSEKISLVRHLDGIIIDEVSMVRCDIMDAIDRTLRQYRKSYAPFGGLQMILVGDMFQLEPIANSEDRSILDSIYRTSSVYFYKSMVISRMKLPKIEFKKIYRQSDPAFINLLEHLRTGRMSWNDMRMINSRVTPEEKRNRMSITLTTTRNDAKKINESMLEAIDSDTFSFEAEYKGECKKGSEVIEDLLVLKKGAQVMFTKNDRNHRWVNGTVGKVTALSQEEIKVTLEDGTEHTVELESWEFCEYEYDKSIKACKKKEVGIATQYPLRLAWAITIHKSQSLTFDHVTVDFGRRAFSNGQAYVALSRARSFEGLELVRPMTSASVLVSKDVMEFATGFNDTSIINRELMVGSATNEFIRNKDYDGAAVMLFGMARDAAGRGQTELACDLMNRSMSFVVDDKCLVGQMWTPVIGSAPSIRLLNAIGLYFKGEIKSAERVLTQASGLENDLNALYILARCREADGDFKSAEEIYDVMISMHNKDIELGMQSPKYRKVIYRVAIFNESHLGKQGGSLIVELMKENTTYGPYISALRSMVIRHPETVQKDNKEKDCEHQGLRNNFLDSNIPDSDLIPMVIREYKAKSEEWIALKDLVKNLKFEDGERN